MTGTFDNWSKSEKMARVGDVFEKAVDLPDTSEKIYYKVGAVSYLSQLSAAVRFATLPDRRPNSATLTTCPAFN